MKSKKIVIIELNEINFDLIDKYISKDQNKLKNFQYLINNFTLINTYGEKEYKNIEPWIHWVSIHTGKEFCDHGVFRLGQTEDSKNIQIFEKLEDKGLSIGALSPMNAQNRLKNPAYFIPDPWTETEPDKKLFSKRIHSMIKQTVNDNSAGRISLLSIFTIIEIIIKTFSIKSFSQLVRKVYLSINNKWYKSLFFDQLINDLNLLFLKREKPDLAFCFFNAGAHIQHHYLYNSEFINKSNINPKWYVENNKDPVYEMFLEYDKIIGDYLKLLNQNYKIIIATGLKQIPYNKNKFYYRLLDHKKFLKQLNINFDGVNTQMTRDFQIRFNSSNQCSEAKEFLSKLKHSRDHKNIFGNFSIKANILSLSLIYSDEIISKDSVMYENIELADLYKSTVFVAIKNGMHSSNGYLFLSSNIKHNQVNKKMHIKDIFYLLENISLQ